MSQPRPTRLLKQLHKLNTLMPRPCPYRRRRQKSYPMSLSHKLCARHVHDFLCVIFAWGTDTQARAVCRDTATATAPPHCATATHTPNEKEYRLLMVRTSWPHLHGTPTLTLSEVTTALPCSTFSTQRFRVSVRCPLSPRSPVTGRMLSAAVALMRGR